MIPRRRFEELFATTRFALLVALPAWLLVVLVGSWLLPSGNAYRSTAPGPLVRLLADSRALGLVGSIPWALFFLGVALGIRDVRKGRKGSAIRKILRATVLAMLACVVLELRRPDLGPLWIGFLLGGLGVLFALAVRGWSARRSTGLVLLLLLAPGSCGYFLGDYDVGPLPEPSPDFPVLRLRAGKPFESGDPTLFLYVSVDGTIGREPGVALGRPPWKLLYTYAERDRDMSLELMPSRTILSLVPNAEAGWDKLRPALAAAGHEHVRIHRVQLLGLREESTEVFEIEATVPYRAPDGERWEFWGAPPKTRVTLTPAARDGVDTAALAARVTEGPVLLAAADGVPAQVVADAIAALSEAGAEPVVLSPDAPEPGGEETLPGVVIRRE